MDKLLQEIKKRIEKIKDGAFIVYHFDIDGVASASIVWRILQLKHIHASFEPATNGWEDVILEKIKKHNPNQIVFLDYAPRGFETEIKDYEVIIIDHHEEEEMPKEFDYFTSARIKRGYAISYLIAKTAERYYNLKVSWLGFLGAFWDKALEATEFWEKDAYAKFIDELLPFNLVISLTKVRGSKKLLKVFNESNSIEDALEKTKKLDDYRKAKELFEKEIASFNEFKIGKVKVVELKTKFKHIRVYVDYLTFKEDGIIVFVLREKGRTKFSFRSTKTEILHAVKKLEKEFPKFRGGGHKNACGGLLLSEDYRKLIERFAQLIQHG